LKDVLGVVQLAKNLSVRPSYTLNRNEKVE